MVYTPRQQLLTDGDVSSIGESGRPLSSRPDTVCSVPFVNSFSSDLSSSHDEGHNNNKELLCSNVLGDEWPLKPASLPASLDRTEYWLKILWDCFMVISSTLLLVKLILVIIAGRADQDYKGVEIDRVSQLTLVLIKINAQMVTVFTVIFVAIISTTLQRYALYKAQQGAPIAEIEQLQGSVSPLTTLKLMWMLKSVTITSVVLSAIWSFYYLGSQANTLEYRFEQSVPFRDLQALIPRNTPEGANSLFLPNSELSDWQVSAVGANAEMVEYHYATTVQPGADPYGFPLIPDLRALSILPNETPDQEGWYDASKQSQTYNSSAYASMIGWPFGIVNGGVPAVFTPSVHWLGHITYSPTYLQVDCSSPTIQSDNAFPPTQSSSQTMSMRMRAVSETSSTHNDTDGYPQKSFEFWLRPVRGLASQPATTTMAVCKLSHKTVDVRVNCQVSGCYAQAIRWASNATSFHTPFTNSAVAQLFFDSFIQNYDSGNVNGFKPAIVGSISQFLQTLSRLDHFNTTQINTTVQTQLHQLFTMYFNTYFTASQMVLLQTMSQASRPNATQAQAGIPARHDRSSLVSRMPIAPFPYDPSLFDKAIFHGALYQPQYIVDWVWISMDLISCLILLGAAVLSLVLRTHTLAPDILSSISSLVRDSPHSGLPNNATGLSGLQRTWLMRKVKVQLGDVSGNQGEGVGRIVLRRVDGEEGSMKTLNKWTVYH